MSENVANCNCSTLTQILDMAASRGSVSGSPAWKYTNNSSSHSSSMEGQSGAGDQCMKQLRRLVFEANRDMWMEIRQQPEYLASADVYSVVILCLFASIIVMLMVRAIKPSETLDDQVNILLSSMRVRVEFEDNARQKQKLMEAKRKAQRWLADAKTRGVKKLSFRRNNSNSESASAEAFMGSSTPTPIGSACGSFKGSRQLSNDTMCSSFQQTISVHSVQSTQSTYKSVARAQPPPPLRLSMGNLGSAFGLGPSPCPSSNATPTPFYSPAVTVVPKERCASSLSNSMRHFFQCSSPSQGKLQELCSQAPKQPHYLNQRASSYQFLPEIVVTTIRHEEQEDEEDSSHSSRQFSRASSSQSLMDDGAGSQDEAECNSINQSNIVFDV